MTRDEACELLFVFSAADFWVRARPDGRGGVRLEVKDEALYGLRASFESAGHALAFLMEKG